MWVAAGFFTGDRSALINGKRSRTRPSIGTEQATTAIENPPIEDWLELLDSVERRVARLLLRPEEAARVRKTIHERFPEAEF